MKLFTLLIALFAYSAQAEVIIYDANGNKKDPDFLVKQGGWVPEAGELTKDDLKKMTKMDFVNYMQQIPDENKPIENQKVHDLGTVIYFIDLNSLGDETVEVMNDLNKVAGVRKVFLSKQPKASSALLLFAIKSDGKLEPQLKMDGNGDVARRMHVTSYPQMVYIMPDQTKAYYSGRSGGLTALKIRIGEVRALKELQERAEKEKSSYGLQ